MRIYQAPKKLLVTGLSSNIPVGSRLTKGIICPRQIKKLTFFYAWTDARLFPKYSQCEIFTTKKRLLIKSASQSLFE